MSTPEDRLDQANTALLADLKEDDLRIQFAFLGKLYHFNESRNAWHGNPSLRFPGVHAFSSDLSVIKSRIESARTKGSSWQIIENPALILETPKVQMALINRWALGQNRIQQIEKALEDPKDMKSLTGWIDKLGYTASKGYYAFLLFGNQRMRPASLPFMRHASRSNGGNYRLAWVQTKNPVQIEWALKLMGDAILAFNK